MKRFFVFTWSVLPGIASLIYFTDIPMWQILVIGGLTHVGGYICGARDAIESSSREFTKILDEMLEDVRRLTE